MKMSDKEDKDEFNLVAYLLKKYMWIFSAFCIIPASLIYDMFWYIKIRLAYMFGSGSSKKHHERVADVQRQVSSVLCQIIVKKVV